jgi:4-amino-4-deoxy-L-arabinose transferase-like glycosyltransferase
LQLNREYFKQHSFFILLLGLAVFLRFLPLYQYQFSHDELSALSRTVYPTISETLQLGVRYGDTHPFLIQVFIYYWIKLFGTSEIAVKLPFLICGILVVIMGYRFSKKWFGINAAIMVSVFFSGSFIFCVYSSYARMYIPGVLFSIGVLHYLYAILYNEAVKWNHFTGFGIFCLLCAFNNHLNALFAFTCALGGLLLVPKKNIKWYVLTLLVTIVCYLPHLPITLSQLQMGGLGASDGGWLPPPKRRVIIEYIVVLMGSGFAGIINMLVLGGITLFSFSKKTKLTSKQWLLLVLFVCNYGIIYFYSIYRSPILQYSVLLFAGVCFLFFAASFAGALSKKTTSVLAFICLCLLLTQVFANKAWTADFHKHVFDQMTTESYKQIDAHRQTNVSSVYFCENYFVVHYLLKANKHINYVLGTDTVLSSPKHFRNWLSGLKTTYLVIGNSYPMSIEIAKEYFPYIENYSEGFFYNVVTLSKLKPVGKTYVKNHVPYTDHLLSKTTRFKLNTKLETRAAVYKLDSLSGKFPLEFTVKFKDLKVKEGEWLIVKLNYEEDSLNLLKDDSFCATIRTNDSTKTYFNSAKFSDFHFHKTNNTLYLQIFAGSELDEWNKYGELILFMWKEDKAPVYIWDLTVSPMDYNPSKWKIWD